MDNENENNYNTCHHCEAKVSDIDIYCPACGKKLIENPLSTTVLKQIWLYFISLFFPPFGFSPAIKYLKQQDAKAKIVGKICLILSIISTGIMIYLIINSFKTFGSTFDSQMELYRDFGL